MSTRDSRREDDLDFIIRETLQTETQHEEPPAYTWNEIQSRLTEKSSTTRTFRMFWLTPALQAALMLVLIFLQGVTPYSYSYSTQATPITSQAEMSSAQITNTRMPTPAASQAETTPVQTAANTAMRKDDDLDMRLLKEQADIAVYDSQNAGTVESRLLPTANVFVRQRTMQQDIAATPNQPRTPILLKHNLDLNR